MIKKSIKPVLKTLRDRLWPIGRAYIFNDTFLGVLHNGRTFEIIGKSKTRGKHDPNIGVLVAYKHQVRRATAGDFAEYGIKHNWLYTE